MKNWDLDEMEFGEPAEELNRDHEQMRDLNVQARREFIDKLSLGAPSEISAQVESLGYKGQDEQRAALSLMAYRHIRRLKRLHVDGIARHLLPPKQNTLLAGPTGCGKTFLVEMLFREIFKLPTVIVDITSFTESGYVGDDVKTILTRLVNTAEGNPLMAECGVICLDEFDKIAASSSNARFAGEGTTKDVSGYGVQRELLTMLHGADVMAPMDWGYSQFGPRQSLSTHDIPFIAAGAFSGMDKLLKIDSKVLGFGSPKNSTSERGAMMAAVSDRIEEIESFQKYGFLPELMGRFTRIVTFPPLSAETQKQILTENVLPQYQREFTGEGLLLSVTDDALDHVVARCLKRGTGARGLHAELAMAVEHAAFENFGKVNNAEVVIDVADGRLISEVKR